MTDLSSKSNSLDHSASRLLFSLGILTGFLIPLKLSLAYAAIIPFVVTSIIVFRRELFSKSTLTSPVLYPLLIFFACTALSSSLGLNPLRSLSKLPTIVFSLLLVLSFIRYFRAFGWRPILTASLLGQSIAGIHTSLDGAFVGEIPRMFLGAVTESGQLAIQLPFALAIVFYFLSQRSASLSSRHVILGLVFLATLTTISFYDSFNYHELILYLTLPLLFVALMAIIREIWICHRNSLNLEYSILILVVIPVLTCALLVNLKRGPWLGVLAASLLLSVLYARKFLPYIFSLGALIVVIFKPIQDRLLTSWEHFTISGGRSEMWEIGIELASRFPTGIGWHNSSVLQSFSDRIPPEHTHFHNNLLNVLVETGWLGLAIFSWWILSVMKWAFDNRDGSDSSLIKIGCGSALLSWQVAGLVEYNFGDSEVLMLGLLYLALLVTSIESEKASKGE